MRLVGCQYCKKARAFWAYDSHGSPHGSYQNAHIEVGTNIFHDTAGRQMRIRYCPMCGRFLLDTRWPIIKKTYIRYCRRFENQNELLGRVLPVAVEPNKTVLNIFGQLDYGRDKYRKYTDYVALTKAFDEIRSKYHNKSFAFPYGFGCGLANGDWNIVENMLNTYFGDMNVTIYRLSARSDEV